MLNTTTKLCLGATIRRLASILRTPCGSGLIRNTRTAPTMGNGPRPGRVFNSLQRNKTVGISDNDVVEDFDFQKLACSDEIASDFNVRFRRSRFTARMTVSDDD